ncbi:AAA family ATPase [Myxococcota bacterium]|nr:AAA family ATPase [Myxococcota bacterium]MBU1897666.1 AAA family ATPase [Myxococcota bacterium]
MKNKQHPLEKISLFGYKSIRNLKNFHISPGLNVLIGANGSGKTNFLRFFELLGHIMDSNKGLQNYVASRGRADAFLFQGMKVTPALSAHLMFGLNEYRFSLQAAADRSLFFSHESAPFDGPLEGRVANDQGSGHLESPLARKHGGTKAEQWVVETIQGWQAYHFHDTSPSAPMMGICNVVDSDVLHSDASNIAAFLKQMAQTHPEHYARIEETVRQVSPFFGAFVLKEISPGRTQLLWKDRFSDLLYYPYQLSDGTIRYICLATLLLQPKSTSAIIIDEPELGLHPYAIKLLASMLYEAAENTQLIISTQSSLLIDEIQPDDVIVAHQRDGETILERLDSDLLYEWLQAYTLGQLWEKNQLGGQP